MRAPDVVNALMRELGASKVDSGSTEMYRILCSQLRQAVTLEELRSTWEHNIKEIVKLTGAQQHVLREIKDRRKRSLA